MYMCIYAHNTHTHMHIRPTHVCLYRCCWGLLAGYNYDCSHFLRETAPASAGCAVAGPLQPLSRAREAIGYIWSTYAHMHICTRRNAHACAGRQVEMLLSLKQQARRSKRMNLQADLLSTMQVRPVRRICLYIYMYICWYVCICVDM